jgi:hypothetical protein
MEIDTWAIIGVNVALIGALITVMIWVVNKLDSDVKAIGTRMDGHAQRIDQVYGIILQMLKER